MAQSDSTTAIYTSLMYLSLSVSLKLLQSYIRSYVCIILVKVLGVRIEVKHRPSLLYSVEEKNIRTLSLGIQN